MSVDPEEVRKLVDAMLNAVAAKSNYTAAEFISAIMTFLQRASQAAIEINPEYRAPIRKALLDLHAQLVDPKAN